MGAWASGGSHWSVLKGLLSAVSGSAMVGYKADDVNAVQVTVSEKISESVLASEFGVIGDGVADDVAAWKAFCGSSVKNKKVDKNVYTSGVGILADGSKLLFVNDSKIYATADVTLDVEASPNNQGQCLEVGNNCVVTGFECDGQGNKGAGVLNDGKSGVVLQLPKIYNGTGQGILDNAGVNSKYITPTLWKLQHGVQLWRTVGAEVRGGEVYQVAGGVWTAEAQNVRIVGVEVHDCSDVGIDFEGGKNCSSYGNTVYRCANGELTIFKSGTGAASPPVMGDLYHRNNICIRHATYTDKNGISQQNPLNDTGSAMVYDLDSVLGGPVVFENNQIHVVDSVATNQLSLRAITNRADANNVAYPVEWRNNVVRTKAPDAFRIQELRKCNFVENKIYFLGSNPNQQEFKNVHDGSFDKNEFHIDSGLTPPARLVMLYTDKVMLGDLRAYKNEVFGGGDTLIYIDQYVSNRRVKIGGNVLTGLDGSSTGGLEINNGTVDMQDQELIFKIADNEVFDLSAKTGLYKSVACGVGEATMQMGGVSGPMYRVAVQTRSTSGNLQMSAIDAGGAVSTGLFPNAARFMTFGATTMQPQDTDGGTPNSALFRVKMGKRA